MSSSLIIFNFTDIAIMEQPSIYDFENIQEYLSFVYEYRKKKNINYSIRDLARNLNLDYSTLSRIISGKRSASLKMTEKICEGLCLTLEDTKYFKEQVLREKKGALTQSEVAKLNYQEVTHDQFSVMSEWYYFAILQLMKVKGFEQDINWISNRLGLEEKIIEQAINRLFRVGLIKEENGIWVDSTKGMLTNLEPGKTSSAIKHHQIQLREMAKDALLEVPIEFRDHSAMTMAIKKSDLKKAKKLIQDFRRSFTKYLERHKEPDEIYQLTISFFPLTKE